MATSSGIKNAPSTKGNKSGGGRSNNALKTASVSLKNSLSRAKGEKK